jgi:hypothetical protein
MQNPYLLLLNLRHLKTLKKYEVSENNKYWTAAGKWFGKKIILKRRAHKVFWTENIKIKTANQGGRR